MNRIRARLVGVGLCTSLVATVNYAAYGQADQPSPATVVEASDVPDSYAPPRYPSGESGVGLVEVADEVRERAIKLLGERYVELWIATSQEWLEVGVHDLRVGEAEKIEAELGVLAPVEAVDRELSRAELDQAERRVAKSLGPDATVSVDYYRQAVRVGIAPTSTDATRRALRAVPYEIVDGGDARSASAARVDGAEAGATPLVVLNATGPADPKESQTTLPVRGAKRLSTPYGACTSGFVVNGAGGRYGMTAGHCGPNGGRVWLGDTKLGKIENNTYVGSMENIADAAVFHLGAEPSQPSIFRAISSRPVVAQASPLPNLAVCVRGSFSSNETCGVVTAIDVTATFQNGHTVTGMFDINWGSGGTIAGDSGSPIYAVNPDGSAVAMGILAGGFEHDDSATPIGTALAATGTGLAATMGRAPFGSLDLVSGGAGSVTIAGWAIDPDVAQTSTQVHVYIGGPAGSGVPGYVVDANLPRWDVAAAYPGTGHQHGFYANLTTGYRGSVPVYVYAIDMGSVPVGHTVWSGMVNIS